MNDISDYSLADIKQFLIDYQEAKKLEPKNWMIGIPSVGVKMYEKACLEKKKIDVFIQAYNNALNGSVEEQLQFVKEMSPVLDDFYGKQKSNSNVNNKR